MSAPQLKKSSTGIWYIHWTDGRRSKRVSTGAKDLVAAKAFFGEWLTLEQQPDKRQDTFTLSDVWQLYVDTPAGRDNRTADAWKPINKFFGQMRLTAITQTEWERYAKARAVKESTLWLEQGKLLQILNFAKKRKLLAELPEIERLPPPLPRDRWLRDEEIDALLTAAAAERTDGRMTPVERFLWLGLYTGARREALVDLRWPQIDFDIGVIHLNPGGRRQTSKKRPSVPIADALLPVLRRMKTEAVNDKVVDATYAAVGHALTRVAKAAKVADVTPHVLRHTWATHAARNGTPLWVIAKCLGNSMLIVERVYAKYAVDDLKVAVNSFGSRSLRAVK
jgi:integrase